MAGPVSAIITFIPVGWDRAETFTSPPDEVYLIALSIRLATARWIGSDLPRKVYPRGGFPIGEQYSYPQPEA